MWNILVIVILCLVQLSVGEYCGYDYDTYCRYGCCGTYDDYCCDDIAALSVGIIVTIVVCVVIGIGAIIAIICCCIRRRGFGGQIMTRQAPGMVITSQTAYGQPGYTVQPGVGSPQPGMYPQPMQPPPYGQVNSGYTAGGPTDPGASAPPPPYPGANMPMGPDTQAKY